MGVLFGGRESGEKWEKVEARENAAAITFLFGQLLAANWIAESNSTSSYL